MGFKITEEQLQAAYAGSKPFKITEEDLLRAYKDRGKDTAEDNTSAFVMPEKVEPKGKINYLPGYTQQDAKEYAEKMAMEKVKVKLPSFVENQGLYYAPGTEKSKGIYLMDSAAKGLVGGVLQAGEAMRQDLTGETGKAKKAYYDYVKAAAYNPQLAGEMKNQTAQLNQAKADTKLRTDTLGYKLLESSQQDMLKATEGMGQTGQFLTGVAGSALQNAYLTPLYLNPVTAPIALGAMAMSAAGRTAKEQADSGKPLDKALIRGAMDGTIEFLTERIGMDSVAKLITGKGDNIVKEILRSVISEAGEEGASYALGYFADRVDQNTKEKVDWEAFRKELGLNMLAGGLSGGLLAGGGMAVGGMGHTLGAPVTQQTQPKIEQPQQNNTEENTVINDNPLGHTTEEMVDIDSYKEATDPKMMAFIQKARSLKDTNVPSKISENVGTVKDTEAQEINRITGIDVSGYKRSVKGDRILHIDTKHGRNGKSDQSLAETEDIARMQWVMDNYDEIVQVIDTEGNQAYSEFFNDKDNKKAPLIAYAKAIDGVYYIVEAVPDSASKTLQLESARIIKKEVYRELNGVNYLSTNVQNGHGLASSNNSIPQTEQNVQDAADANFDTVKDINVPDKTDANTNVVPQADDTGVVTLPATQADMGAVLPEQRQQKTANLVPEKIAKEQAKKAGNDLPESVGAMKSGYYAAVDEYGAFPEGEKVTNPVDVPMSVDGVHGVTRGVRTIMEAAATKEDMLSDYETAIANGEFNYDINRDKDAVEKAVTYIEKYGFENTYNEWRKKVDNKQTITKDDMTQAQIMYASAVAEGDYDIAMKLATDIAVQATKAGQVVQSMRILKKTTPEGRLYYAQKSVEAIQDDVNEKYGDKAPELEVPKKLLDNLKNARTDEEIRKATAEINQAVADQLPFSWSNFINSWRYLAMLGNTRTQVRNIASNIIGTVAQEYTNFVQTGIESIVSKAGKNIEKTSAVKTTEWQRKQAEEDYKAVRETLHGAGKYRNDTLQGIQKLQNPFDFKGKGGKAGKAVGDVLTKWNDVTNWAMDEGDKLFSRPAYLRYYARYLAANNITSEAQLTSKVKLRARSWATKQAKEAVYREENALAKWISGMEKDLAQSNKATVRTGAKIVGGIMPFRGTPLNITKRAFEYTPVGIAMELINNKNSNPVETINKAAKSLSGTSLIVLGYALAKSGILTGGLGSDKEDKMKEQMGQQPYSVNVGNYSYTLDWGGAGIMPLFIGAEMYNSTAEDSENFLMALLDTFANASAPVMETSMMTGLMDALKTASYEDNMAESITSFLASGLSSYIGQFVPTILGQVARAVDDTSRSSYTNVKGVMKPLAKTIQKMENKIPLLSKTNVPYMDVWGKEVKNFGGSLPGRLAYNMLSPGYAEKKSTDKVEKMLYDLYDKTGDKEVLPKNYTTSSEKNGVTTRFTPAQFEKYTKVYGQTAYNLIEELYSDNLYKNRSDEEKAGYIKKAYEAALKTAQTSVVNYKHDNSTTKRMNALNEGIPMSLVYASLVLEKKMDTDNSNGINQTEAKDYIDKYGADLSDAQKAKLFSIYSPTTKNNPYE